MKLIEYDISFHGPHLVRGPSSITGHVVLTPPILLASVVKTIITLLSGSVGVIQIQRLEDRHNSRSVEMTTMTTAEGTRTPPVLQKFLYFQTMANDLL